MRSWSHFKRLRLLHCRAANTFVLRIITTTTLAATVLINGPQWLAAAHDIVPRPSAICDVHLLLAVVLLTGLATLYLALRPTTVYLVDYACFQASSCFQSSTNCRYPKATILEHAQVSPLINDSTVNFIDRVLQRSGMSDETYVPPAILYVQPYYSLEEARAEAELVVFSVVDDLLAKTCVNLHAIGLLVTNCTVFCPVPSIADMIVNRYKLPGDLRVMNLSGMGCSAALTAVGVARNILQTMPSGSNALVVSTETTLPGYYHGNNMSMQLMNILFRMGGAAKLLSTSRCNARFRLAHVMRTTTSAINSSYRCVYQEEDKNGNLGMALSKDLTAVAGDALKANIAATAPLILPVSELLKFSLFSLTKRAIYWKRVAPYIPNFRAAFEHFCIHVGGPAVINSVQQGLNLSAKDVEPSRMTLHRFGNQSTASVWYELAYIDAKDQIKEGNRVWMIGFGAGYECCTVGWVCIRPSSGADGPWASCIHRYPLDVYKTI